MTETERDRDRKRALGICWVDLKEVEYKDDNRKHMNGSE